MKHIKKSYYRFLTWFFFWFSISFFFFLSNYKPTPSFTTTILPRSLPSHLVFENPSNEGTRFNGIKVYVYDLPPKFNAVWLQNERCRSHLFAAEVAIHMALINSVVRTLDPSDADFFFVPVYVSCNFSQVNGFPAIAHARGLMASAVHHISHQFPFWNRSGGADHVFVASHDFGACFHTMEDAAKIEGVPEFLKNSIILQTFGVKERHPCQEVENVVIPPYIPPESIRAVMPLTGQRDIFAFFRGKMEVHPKNISGRFYSRRVRTKIWRKYAGNRKFYLRRHRFGGYLSEIARSKFCLCPLGWAPWSPRLVESVALGCVPVIIADGISLPFPTTVPWADISVTVAEDDVDELGNILEHVAATNLSRIQRNLQDPDVRRALLFHNPMLERDATWHVLVSLSQKLDRSFRSSRLSIQ